MGLCQNQQNLRPPRPPKKSLELFCNVTVVIGVNLNTALFSFQTGLHPTVYRVYSGDLMRKLQLVVEKRIA